ncbi:MAG: zinc ribbon domain-containing protein [Elusimicrobiota bacterium]
MPATIARVQGKIPIENSYTSGIAGDKTLRALKERGEFIGTTCEACRMTYFPARMFCERCLCRILENETKVGPEGTLEVASLLSVNQEGKKTKPYYVGLIKFDGAGTRILHHVKIHKGQNLTSGRRVRPLLKAPDKRVGSITDIIAFELI